jgi:hypothetical protein
MQFYYSPETKRHCLEIWVDEFKKYCTIDGKARSLEDIKAFVFSQSSWHLWPSNMKAIEFKPHPKHKHVIFILIEPYNYGILDNK